MFGGFVNPILAIRAWRRISASPEYAHDARMSQPTYGTATTELGINLPVLEVTPIDTRQVDVSNEAMLTNNRGLIKRAFMRHAGYDAQIQKVETLLFILCALSWMHFNSRSDRFGLLMAIVFTIALFQIKRI
jgi:hypothetical protein